ncbi:MAG: cupin domain-containing protein [Candidatus Saccharimonadales bacterium]
MKPVKYSLSDTNKIDLGTKVIHKYPTPTPKYDIGHMEVKGRFPLNSKFNLNTICDFIIYVTKNTGVIFAGSETFSVEVGDVVFIPKNNKYAVEGNFEYITIDVPAFSPEQSAETN